MKVLHIIDDLSMGGAQNLLIGLAGEQVNRGDDVVIAPLVCEAHTPVRDKLESKGVKVTPFRERGSVYNPLFIFRIAKMLCKYDVVHVHLFPALYWAGFARALSFSNVPLIYTEHSTKNKRRSNKVLHFVDRIVYQCCYNHVVACADKALETFKESYPSITHVSAINNGVDIDIYRNAEAYTKRKLLDVDENSFLITMVARFMTMKRQDTVVESIAKLPSVFHAVFVGGEASDEGLVKVKDLAKSLGVESRVHFLYVRSDVPRILKTSDIVVMASDYEGLSLSSIEGMAAGKPFVATNVNGLREVVGGAGILFENKDSGQLAQIINQLYEDKKLYYSTSKSCQQRAKEYDIKNMTEDYMRIYSQIIM